MIRLLILAALIATPASAHSWYTGTRDPKTGFGCCSGADCAPIDPRKVACDRDGCTLTLDPGDTPTVRVAGRYRYFGNPQTSPDMEFHACFYGPGAEQAKTPEGFVGVIRCFWWGGGS